MITATRSKKQDTEVLLENETISKAKKILEKRKEKEKVEKNKEKEKKPGEPGEEDEIPFARVKPLPEVTREKRKPAEGEKEPKGSYRNIAPLQNDEKAISLIKEALKVPVNVTTEDLLNISEAARQELKKLLIKKRVEKTQSLMTKEIEESQNMIHAEQLPSASYEVLEEERSGIPKGSLIIGDPVICRIIKSKLQAGVYEPSNSSYRSRWFCVIKKDGKNLRIVHSLEPLNEVT